MLNRAFIKRTALWCVVHLSPRFRYRIRRRRRVAAKFVRGRGLEIGALHVPLQAPAAASVLHVDYRTTEQLRRMHPELALLRTVNVDIVDDGEGLSGIRHGSLDFVVANHVIEHCENPILNVMARDVRLPFRVEVVTESSQEFLVVLRKVENVERPTGGR